MLIFLVREELFTFRINSPFPFPKGHRAERGSVKVNTRQIENIIVTYYSRTNVLLPRMIIFGEEGSG